MEEEFGPLYTDLPWETRGPGSAFMRAFEGHKMDFGTSTDLAKSYDMPLVMRRASSSWYYDDEESEVRIYE